MRRQRQETTVMRNTGGSSRCPAPPPPLLCDDAAADTLNEKTLSCITVDIAMDAVAEQCLARGLNDSALWLDELHLDALPAVLDEILSRSCPLTRLVTLDSAWASTSHERLTIVKRPNECDKGNKTSTASIETCGHVARLRRHHRVALALFLRGEYQRCHYLLSHVLQEYTTATTNINTTDIDEEEEEEEEDVHAAELASMSADVISPEEDTNEGRQAGRRRSVAGETGAKKKKSTTNTETTNEPRTSEVIATLRVKEEEDEHKDETTAMAMGGRQRQRRRRSVTRGPGGTHVTTQSSTHRHASASAQTHSAPYKTTTTTRSEEVNMYKSSSSSSKWEEGNGAGRRRVTPPLPRRRGSTASRTTNTPTPPRPVKQVEEEIVKSFSEGRVLRPCVPTAMVFLCYYALYMDGQKVKTTSGNPQRTLNPHLRTLRAQLMELFCGASYNQKKDVAKDRENEEEGDDENVKLPHTPSRTARRSSRTSPLPQPTLRQTTTTTRATPTPSIVINSRTISPIAPITTTTVGSARARATLPSSSRTTPPPQQRQVPASHVHPSRGSPIHDDTINNEEEDNMKGTTTATAQFPPDLLHQDPYLCWLMGVVLRDLGMSQESATYLLASVTNNPLLWCAWQDLALLITQESQLSEMEAILSASEPRFMTELFLAHVKAALGLAPLSRGFHACHFAATAADDDAALDMTAQQVSRTTSARRAHPYYDVAVDRTRSSRGRSHESSESETRPAPVIATRDDNKVNTLNRMNTTTTTSSVVGDAQVVERVEMGTSGSVGSPSQFVHGGRRVCKEANRASNAEDAPPSGSVMLHRSLPTVTNSRGGVIERRTTTAGGEEEDDVLVEHASERDSSSSSSSIISATSGDEKDDAHLDTRTINVGPTTTPAAVAHPIMPASIESHSPRVGPASSRLQNTWKLLLELFPDSLYLQGRLAAYYYHQRKELDKAQQIYAEIHRRCPHALDHVADYSNILFIQRDYHALSSLAQRVYQVDPFRAESNFVVGNFYVAMGQHERSVLHFRRAVAIQPNFVAAWTLLGHGYVELKNTTAAVEAYRTAIELDQRDYRGWYNLGQIYELLQAYHHALYYYWHTTSLRPTDPRMWAAVGSCLEHDGRRQESIICFERAEAYESINSEIYPGLVKRIADYYATQGNYARACVYLDKLLQSPATGPEDRRYAMHNLVQFHIMLANQVITPVLHALDALDNRAGLHAHSEEQATSEEDNNNTNTMATSPSNTSKGRRRTTVRYMPSTFGRTSPPYAYADNNTTSSSTTGVRLPDVLRSSVGPQQQQQQPLSTATSYRYESAATGVAPALQAGRRANVSHETMLRAERQAMLHIHTAETQLENLLIFLGAPTGVYPLDDTLSHEGEDASHTDEIQERRPSQTASQSRSTPPSVASRSAHTTPLHTSATNTREGAGVIHPVDARSTSAASSPRVGLRSSLRALRVLQQTAHAGEEEEDDAEVNNDVEEAVGVSKQSSTRGSRLTPPSRRGANETGVSAELRERQLEALYASLVQADPSDKSGMGLFVRVMRRQLLLMRQMLQQLRSAMR